MGTQQLLLIVVGIIVIGLAIYAGIIIMRANSESTNRDQIISTLYDLGLMAQQHYKKPREQGGGAGTYTGWTLPSTFNKTETGSFSAVVRSDRIDLSADGIQIGRNETTVVRATARINSDGISITVIN